MLKKIAAAFLLLLGESVFSQAVIHLPGLNVESDRATWLYPKESGTSQTISRAEIENSQARNLTDVLQSRGGLWFSSSGGESSQSSVQWRGFGENASSRVLILIDGQAQPSPEMGGVSLQDIPVQNIERIEILPGGQTARFGDRAVAGVINITTAAKTERTQIETTVGLADDWQWRFSHQSPHWQFSSGHLQREGWRDNASEESENYALGYQNQFRAFDWRVKVFFNHRHHLFPGSLSLSDFQQNPRQSIYSQSGQGNLYASDTETYRLESEFGELDFWRGKLQMPLNLSREEQAWDFGLGSHTNKRLDALRVQPTWKGLCDFGTFEPGFSFAYEDLDLTQFRDVKRTRPLSQAELNRSSISTFVRANGDICADWTWQSALRHEMQHLDAGTKHLRFTNDPQLNFSSEKQESHYAWQLGTRWQADENQAAWLRLDRIYRFPAIDEVASYQGFAMATPFNDRLRAETGHNLELGTSYQFGNWHCQLNTFAQRLNDEIAYDYVQNLNVNLASTHRLGAEIETRYAREHWQVSFRYTRQRAFYTDGAYDGHEVYLVPRHRFIANFEISPWKNTTLGIEQRVQGASFEGNDFLNIRSPLPAYAVTNWQLRHQFSKNWQASCHISNLFASHYATLKYQDQWYPAAGRQVQLFLKYAF